MLHITTTGQFAEVDVDPNDFSPDGSLRQLLGGYMELVHPKRLPEPYVMLVNDAGLLRQLPINAAGSWLYGTDEHFSPIVGDILICREGWTSDGSELFGLKQSDYKALFELLSFAVIKEG